MYRFICQYYLTYENKKNTMMIVGNVGPMFVSFGAALGPCLPMTVKHRHDNPQDIVINGAMGLLLLAVLAVLRGDRAPPIQLAEGEHV
jgi:hypothetical protein